MQNCTDVIVLVCFIVYFSFSFILTACATAAFDNCAECGDVNATTGVAECEECASGFTLEDELETLSCKCTSFFYIKVTR